MSQITITLLFLLFAIAMFMWEKIPLGLTSMIVCVGLVVTGVLEWQTAFEVYRQQRYLVCSNVYRRRGIV